VPWIGCRTRGRRIACRRSHATDGSRAGRRGWRRAATAAGIWTRRVPGPARSGAAGTDALARRTGSNARPRLDCWRGVSLVVDPGGSACPVAGPLEMDNRVFRVRDVTDDEDRVHRRKVGHRVSGIRNGAITLLRQLNNRSIPDAHRAIAAQPALAFALLGA
jgi:hypothetical protein